MSDDFVCDPITGCFRSQSCIVLRRKMGDWVHEDTVFRAAGLPLRASCSADVSAEQAAAMRQVLQAGDSAVASARPSLQKME